MKLKPTTLMLVASVLVLGGVALLVQSQPQQTTSPTTPGEKSASQVEGAPPVRFKEDDVQRFTLETEGRSLSFERNAQGKWQMTAPEKQPANDAAVAYLLNVMTTGVSRTVTVPGGDRKPYGLEPPLATIHLDLKNQQQHQLVIGGYNFDRTSLYAQLDPPTTPTANLTLLLVSPDFETAVKRPTPEWSISPTPSPTPAKN